MRTALALSLLALLAAAPARAETSLATVADELRKDGVYVAPDAELKPTAAQEDELESAVADDDPPVYVAVLPGGDADALVQQLGKAVGEQGTYAVVAGRSFRAGSNALPKGVAPRLARVAFDQRRSSGVGPVLLEFERRVDAEQSGSGGSPRDTGGGDDTLLYVLGGAALLGGGYWLRKRRRRAQAAAAELAGARELTEEDLVALAEDVQALETDVEASPAAVRHYQAALSAYERANHRFDRVRDARELAEVTSQVEEGRYEMAAARAVLDGRPVPERRPPCFFDPRHGPSTRDVEWAPPGGEPRPVPACEADALRVEEGAEPDTRRVRGEPYWNTAGAGPWAAGYFGFGLLPTLFMGSMLGAMMFPPAGYGGGYDTGGYDTGGGDFDGGDFGGGDFGGGDMGGGDFGGGDF